MNPLTAAILRTGIIDKNMLREQRRFGAPIEEPPPDEVPVETPEAVATIIEEALQSEGLVLTRETDLEVLRDYTESNRRAVLHLELQDGTAKSDVEVTVGQTKGGDYIIPCLGESIMELMTNGASYLMDPNIKGENKVFFDSVRDLFFGNVRAFMVCRKKRER